MKLDTIKDPKLRQRILDAMHNVSMMKSEIEAEIPSKTKKKRIRQRSSDGMNNLEREAMAHLHIQYPLATIRPHSMKLEIANGCWLFPDFCVFLDKPPIQIYEIKGKHAWEDSLIKLKVAARTWESFDWWLMWKDEISWKAQKVLP